MICICQCRCRGPPPPFLFPEVNKSRDPNNNNHQHPKPTINQSNEQTKKQGMENKMCNKKFNWYCRLFRILWYRDCNLCRYIGTGKTNTCLFSGTKNITLVYSYIINMLQHRMNCLTVKKFSTCTWLM